MHNGSNDAGGGGCQRRSPPAPPLASDALALVIDCRPRIGVCTARQTLSNNCPPPIIITRAMASSVATAVTPGRSAALAPSGLVAILEGGQQRRQRRQNQRRGEGVRPRHEGGGFDAPHREDDGGMQAVPGGC